MAMISKTAVGIAVGIAGIVGYCYYFDKKRRGDPDFKKKLRERRRAKKEAQKEKSRIPNLKNPEEIQKFFLQEVELGEELLGAGNLEAGIEHLTNAVAVCGQPHQLLTVLQKTLSPIAFNLLIQRLSTVGQKMNPSIVMAEDDVE